MNMKRNKNIYLSITIVLLLGIIASFMLLRQDKSDVKATDYASADNWLTVPASAELPVDVFYLYPTTYMKQSENDPTICQIDNEMMRTNAALSMNRQATAFETVGNIYAPYYRQADAIAALSMSEADRDALLKGEPMADVIAAFDYYIKNYNDGRPFILAGHSQGSNMLLYLLSDYMKDHPDVYSRMVAAYVIGYSVTEDYLAENPHLKFAEGPADTGVIISYNTEAPVTGGKNPVIMEEALVINPITWTRDGTKASAAENLGSIMLNPDGTVVLDEKGEFMQVMNFADATVDSEKGALICSTVDAAKWAPGNPLMPSGIFHSFDYPFYFFNIRENAKTRVQAYLGQ